jgi:uncharacterized protein YggE
MERRHAIMLGFLAVSCATLAQETPVPIIESAGAATVESIPDYVEFWLHHVTPGETATAAANRAVLFEEQVQDAIAEHDLSPSHVVFSGLSLKDVNRIEFHQSVCLRFPAGSFAIPEKGPTTFAKLTDQIAALARQLECGVEGPSWHVEKKEALEEEAIVQAMENAYPSAKAAASAMNGHVLSVERVEVQSIEWNRDPETRAQQPDLQRITCTARVKIAYAFSGYDASR